MPHGLTRRNGPRRGSVRLRRLRGGGRCARHTQRIPQQPPSRRMPWHETSTAVSQLAAAAAASHWTEAASSAPTSQSVEAAAVVTGTMTGRRCPPRRSRLETTRLPGTSRLPRLPSPPRKPPPEEAAAAAAGRGAGAYASGRTMGKHRTEVAAVEVAVEDMPIDMTDTPPPGMVTPPPPPPMPPLCPRQRAGKVPWLGAAAVKAPHPFRPPPLRYRSRSGTRTLT
mmetsp:Transcript_16766/g.41290  ORF Transcript_16766/g.41290 Transcript_16766/m.41290 type:complete len:225 (+) Transcript_16766:216-890(+)